MILFEVFLKADDRVEFIYENLELFVMGIVTVYLFHCIIVFIIYLEGLWIWILLQTWLLR